MTKASRCVCAAGVLSILAVTVSPAAPAAGVIVRAYNTYGVPSRDIHTASQTVQLLLSTIAIDTRWRNCRVAGRPPHEADPCSARPVVQARNH
jgi:hypothetical protein